MRDIYHQFKTKPVGDYQWAMIYIGSIYVVSDSVSLLSKYPVWLPVSYEATLAQNVCINVLKPLIDGYIFVGFKNGDVSHVLELEKLLRKDYSGVHVIPDTDGNVAVCSDEFVAELAKPRVYRPELPDITIGNELRIPHGPFSGRVGQVVSVGLNSAKISVKVGFKIYYINILDMKAFFLS